MQMTASDFAASLLPAFRILLLPLYLLFTSSGVPLVASSAELRSWVIFIQHCNVEGEDKALTWRRAGLTALQVSLHGRQGLCSSSPSLFCLIQGIVAASWQQCVQHCLGGGYAAEHKENIVSVQVYLLLIAPALGCVNQLFKWKKSCEICVLVCVVCFALYCIILMYNNCVYLTNHVAGMSVWDCFGMADWVWIDGFWANFENQFKPSQERVTDLESLIFKDAHSVTFNGAAI